MVLNQMIISAEALKKVLKILGKAQKEDQETWLNVIRKLDRYLDPEEIEIIKCELLRKLQKDYECMAAEEEGMCAILKKSKKELDEEEKKTGGTREEAKKRSTEKFFMHMEIGKIERLIEEINQDKNECLKDWQDAQNAFER